MFQHAAATGQSAHEHAICQGQREPSPEWDLLAEPTTMELINPNSQHQNIKALYYGVYLLHRLPGQSRCEKQTAELLHKESLDSIKECLRLQQPPKQQVRQQMQWPAKNHRPDPPMAFTSTNPKAYEEMMALAGEAQQQAVAMAAIIEEERGHSTGHQCPTNCQCSANHRRSRSSGQRGESSQVTSHHRGTETGAESSQVTSCHGGTEDVNLYEYQEASWATSCQRGAIKGE